MLAKASQHLLPDIQLIVASASLFALSATMGNSLAALISAITAFVLGVVIFSRIATRIAALPNMSWIEHLRKNFVNYSLVILVVYSPKLLFSFPASLVQERASYFVAREFVSILLATATVYFLPVVFLRQSRFIAIPVGLAFLRHHFRASLPIIATAASSSLITTLATPVFAALYNSQGSQIQIVLFALMLNLITNYLFFLAFSAATCALVPTIDRHSENGA